MTEESTERTLGKLLAQVEALNDKFDASEDRSEKSRAAVHGRMDALIKQMSKIETDQATMQADIDVMKPVTEDVTRWRLVGMGALGATGIAFTALGVTFADAIRRVVGVITGHG